ncbi:hypothetical protein EB796_006278 [Bugula neritina]|uniref:Fungal lipase-type domain-containing protein n=1 Tax=Bugula neritina TaxID=10212 RepID=A0A7J7KBT4_BUGNE|nr:hypothetical protein EB796_006278 [Bugula neritina]
MDTKQSVILLTLVTAALACSQHQDCDTCSSSSIKILFTRKSCVWCPLTNSCHISGIPNTYCNGGQLAKSSAQCSSIADPPMTYDPALAAELAKWASLSYVDPKVYDKASIQSAVSTQFGSNYQVVEFLTVDCDWIFQFDFCSAVIAKSLADDRIIVAFEGTSSPAQLTEQFVLSFTGLKSFDPTGGEILEYNKKTHDALYPCVKSLLEELLTAQPTAEVMVTGHSLGGAQAQLAAAHLVKDGVVSSDKLHVYTFGSPRVGDKDFAYGYDRLLGNSWRVTRKNDPIPLIVIKSTIPISLPNSCFHTRREVYYSGSGIMTSATAHKICMSNEAENGCLEKDGFCVLPDCFLLDHQKYFSSDLPQLMKGAISKNGTPPTQGTRGACRSYAI